MGVVGRLNQYASMQAAEFDDYSMSENLINYSEQFNNAVWTKVNSSITQNSITAPDGLITADTLIENTSAGAHLITRTINKSSSPITYTYSIFAKLKDTRNIQIIFSDQAGSTASVTVNLSNGSIISGPNAGGTFSNQDAKVISFPNQWYRITLKVTTNSTTSFTVNTYLHNNSGIYTGDGTSGIYIWGAQLEESSVATDYTPTTTTAKTRVLSSTTNTNITGLGTYYSSGFDENVGFTTFLPANISVPYDPVYDEFGGTLFGAGQGRYMRQYTDKSVIVYNEIDEITVFGYIEDIDVTPSNTTWWAQSGISPALSTSITITGINTTITLRASFSIDWGGSGGEILIYRNSQIIGTFNSPTTSGTIDFTVTNNAVVYFSAGAGFSAVFDITVTNLSDGNTQLGSTFQLLGDG